MSKRSTAIGAKRQRSQALRQRAHELIPGGAHTYAKGDDQYPVNAPAFIACGAGSHVWDVDGNEFIEYGSGMRSVVLGHAHPKVLEAVRRELDRGTNFVRPAAIEIEAAEALLSILPRAEMVKFAKNGSDVTTAALKLARAATGREMVALCGDQPFFSCDDWFIGSTAMPAGIPQAIRDLSVTFRYNDLQSLEQLFERHPQRIAAVILEAAAAQLPAPGFLAGVRALCTRHGAVMILDEMITGFRWHLGGAQAYYDIEPDLSTFGKGIANGFALAALAGKRSLMELGGLRTDRERVFLLSTTHGAETHALAAMLATIDLLRGEDLIARLWQSGETLARAVQEAAAGLGLERQVGTAGAACNLVYFTCDAAGQPSQQMRTLFMQELIERGVLGPSFVVSAAHDREDLNRTAAAVRGALEVYRKALDQGVESFLRGPAVKPVFRPRV